MREGIITMKGWNKFSELKEGKVFSVGNTRMLVKRVKLIQGYTKIWFEELEEKLQGKHFI